MSACNEIGSCDEWGGEGYHRIWHDGKMVLEHRLRYAEANGLSLSAIDGKVVRHRCDNPACRRPSHLLLGSTQDNVDDRMARGRHRSGVMPGEVNAQHKLTEEDVRVIRSTYVKRSREFGIPAFARRYGVCVATIHEALTGKGWAHV